MGEGEAFAFVRGELHETLTHGLSLTDAREDDWLFLVGTVDDAADLGVAEYAQVFRFRDDIIYPHLPIRPPSEVILYPQDPEPFPQIERAASAPVPGLWERK